MRIFNSERLEILDSCHHIESRLRSIWGACELKEEYQASQIIKELWNDGDSDPSLLVRVNDLILTVTRNASTHEFDAYPRKADQTGCVNGQTGFDVASKVILHLRCYLFEPHFRDPEVICEKNLQEMTSRLLKLNSPPFEERVKLLNQMINERSLIDTFLQEQESDKEKESGKPAAKSKKKKAGRPPCSEMEQKIDRELLREWNTANYQDYEHLSNKFHIRMSAEEVDKRIRRERQRQKRAKQK